ncbi:MAG: DUF6247 family protein [bacterium]|nr:DUF6247 family protein [bacterium]
MIDEAGDELDGVLTGDPRAARAEAWAEHQRRCTDNEPYTDGVTAEALTERIEGFAAGTARIRHAEHDYAPAVSGEERRPPAVDCFYDEGSEIPHELPWMADLPECDRRLFAEEMSQLMAEAAETDDLAPVQQALREWRATAEVHADPELSQRLSGPIVANGPRVPKPAI